MIFSYRKHLLQLQYYPCGSCRAIRNTCNIKNKQMARSSQRSFSIKETINFAYFHKALLSGTERLVVPICLVALLLFAGPTFADPVPAQPSTTEVPAAVNAIVTDENEQLERENQSKQPKRGKTAEHVTKVKLILSIDGKSAGPVVIKTFVEPPVGSKRFSDIARRKAGGYRLSKVDGISDEFVTISGVLQLNYVGMPEIAGGETVEQLQAEQNLYARSHDRPGYVSLIVEDAIPKDIREKVVAYQGKLIKVQEVRGSSNANGTGLAITLKPAPILDRTNLIVGEVVEGFEVVEQLAKLPKVKSSSQSPFFKVAKAVGDRRADVAARSFGKPLGKVFVEKVIID